MATEVLPTNKQMTEYLNDEYDTVEGIFTKMPLNAISLDQSKANFNVISSIEFLEKISEKCIFETRDISFNNYIDAEINSVYNKKRIIVGFIFIFIGLGTDTTKYPVYKKFGKKFKLVIESYLNTFTKDDLINVFRLDDRKKN